MEGTHPFEGGENPEGAVLPIFEYGRDAGCSVIGGYVYRGEEIPGLQGTYLYADYCGAGVRGLQVDGDTVIDDAHVGPPARGRLLLRPGRRRRALRAPRRWPRREARPTRPEPVGDRRARDRPRGLVAWRVVGRTLSALVAVALLAACAQRRPTDGGAGAAVPRRRRPRPSHDRATTGHDHVDDDDDDPPPPRPRRRR